jgi:hypothetical protein
MNNSLESVFLVSVSLNGSTASKNIVLVGLFLACDRENTLKTGLLSSCGVPTAALDTVIGVESLVNVGLSILDSLQNTVKLVVDRNKALLYLCTQGRDALVEFL